MVSKKYLDRPSPPISANENCGATAQGNDGQMYVSVANIKGICRWVLLKEPSGNQKTSRKVTRKASKKVTRKASRKASRKSSRKSSRKVTRKSSGKVTRKSSKKSSR
jgi:hypothetical protein